jgi:hypothetical protein
VKRESGFDAATLIVIAPANASAKLRALGSIGVSTLGGRRQRRHLTIARSEDPHLSRRRPRLTRATTAPSRRRRRRRG